MTYLDTPGQEIGERSEDGQYEWDGEEWVPTADAIDDLVDDLTGDMPAPPQLQVGERSEDGQYEWDGQEWVPTADAIDQLVDDLASPIAPPRPEVGERSEDGLYVWDGNEWTSAEQRLTDLVAEVAEEWAPDERAMGDAADGNQAALKGTRDGGTIGYQVGAFMLLIGDNHPDHYFQYVQAQRDYAQGAITIEKGGFRSAGSLLVTGCPPAKQGVVESLISEFSKKQIRFQ